MTILEDSECQFSATTNSVAHVASILSAISAVNSRVVVNITDDGICFITENSHICRVEFTLEKGLFTNYFFNGALQGGEDEDEDKTEVRFTVDIIPIVESLSLVNRTQTTGTQCSLIYQGDGYPFVLIYEDSKITERCEFSTYVNLDFEANNMGFELNQDEILMEGMIKADVLYDALKDLKDINTEDIYLYASTKRSRHKRLAIISKGEMGNSSLYLPNDRSIMEQLHVSNESKIDVSCYKFSIFNMALRAMRLSNKCKFKRDHNILSLNLLCLFGNDLPKNYTGTVFDFKMLQLVDRDEQIQYFIEENEESDKTDATAAPQADHDYDNNDQDNNDVDIDVPVFL